MARNAMDNLENASTSGESEAGVDAPVEAPVDTDEGLTIIDTMTAKDGDTEFTVAQNKNKSYLAFNFGADLEAMAEKFGAAVVFSFAKAQMIVKAQAVTRPFIGKGVSAIDVLKSWVPGVKRVAGPVDKKAAANDFVATASLEDLEVMLAQIKSRKENS